MSQQGSSDARVSALAADLRTSIGQLRRRLREQAQRGDLSGSQRAVIGLLAQDGSATVTTLARAERMRPQSMGATIATLETAGLLRGAPDPSDGRQTILSLTDVGRAWIAADRAAREDWLSRAIESSLSPKEQGELARALALIRRLVDT